MMKTPIAKEANSDITINKSKLIISIKLNKVDKNSDSKTIKYF